MPKSAKNKFIAVAGNIGVGKTTLTELLCRRFGWEAYFEKFVENPYLVDFYEDMRKWAFHSQMFFLKERIKDHMVIQKLKTTCVQDRIIYEDAEIFARNLFERDLMSQRDYAVYKDLYEAVRGLLRPPDLIVYLRASTWTLLTRIRKRGREYEQQIDKEYLMQLNTLYEKWVKSATSRYRVLIVDTNEFDMHRDSDWLDGIVEEIGREAVSNR